MPSAADEQRELVGTTAVVTGSSSGIGRAIAIELATAGADVAVHARRSREAAQSLVSEIGALGRQSTCLLADIAEADQCTDLVERAWNWQGHVDIWINNAGADVLTGESGNWSFEEKVARLWQVDVQGSIRISRDVGRRMKRQTAGDATIVNVGWDQAEQGMGGDSGEMFAATKGAIMAFSRSLAQSLAPTVRVNCLAPGWIQTGWGRDASPYWHERAIEECLLRRWGTPQDVARVARFLVSPAAQFISGQIVRVNGGFRFGDPGGA